MEPVSKRRNSRYCHPEWSTKCEIEESDQLIIGRCLHKISTALRSTRHLRLNSYFDTASQNILKIKKIIPLFLFVLLFLQACDETDYMTYDTAHNGVYFKKDSLTYSFGVTPTDVKSHTVKIPVSIMGGLSDNPRSVAYRIIEYGELPGDTLAARQGLHYNISEAVVEPDSITGYISVEVLRDNLEGSNLEGFKRYRLGLQLLKNDNFEPTLAPEDQSIILTFDNAVERPEWYNGDEENPQKVWMNDDCGLWHPLKLIKMVEFFHQIETVNDGAYEQTYKKMVVLFGENLEHVKYADPYPYLTIFRRFVFRPMYEYFSDPANFDFIFTEYPDFPRNEDGTPEFPNPDK